jgi:hypothetical protein
MGEKWTRIGKVTHTDENGETWEREVAQDKDSGKVERQFGDALKYPESKGTDREVGTAGSEDAALEKAKEDLDDTF